MSDEIILNADLRIRTGTNKTREIRREDSMVPAIIYGNDEESKNIKVKLNELTKASENELFYTQILKIVLEGHEEKVVLKELQREPVKGKFLHADFQRVSRKTKLKVLVPFRFIGEEDCEGVKVDGGVIAKTISEIEIACLAGNIPEAIEIDITELKLNESIRLTEINFPEGSEIPSLDDEYDQMIVSVNPPRAEIEEEEIIIEGEEGDVLEGEEVVEGQSETEESSEESSAAYKFFKLQIDIKSMNAWNPMSRFFTSIDFIFTPMVVFENLGHHVKTKNYCIMIQTS